MAVLFFCIHSSSYFVYEYVYVLRKDQLIRGVLTDCAVVPAGKISG